MTAPLRAPLDSAAQAALVFAQLNGRLAAHAELDAELRIVAASASFRGLLPEPTQPVEGQPLPEVLDEFVGAEARLQAVLRGEAADYRVEQLARRQPDDTRLYFNFVVVPLQAAPRREGLLLIVEDVTDAARHEQRLTQDRNELRLLRAELDRSNTELQRLSRYKSFLLSMVAHDLRSPLTAISGYTEVLLDEALPEERAPLLAIGAVSKRMRALIDNLVDLDQIEHGQIKLQREACDLNTLTHDVVGAHRTVFALRNQQLELALHPGPIALVADSARLQQVLDNLLNNAVKYTPEGGRLRVRTALEGGWAVWQLTDSGRGMTAQQLSNLFQLYYRTEDARQTKIPGTGLGLYIVRTLVEAHGGRVEAASQLGVGTTLTVYLPVSE